MLLVESSFYINNALLSVSMNGEMKSSVINSKQNLSLGFKIYLLISLFSLSDIFYVRKKMQREKAIL